jgi:hypothetical protein
MTPRLKSTVRTKKPGKAWKQSAAVTQNKDLLGRTGSMTVNVRSGNVDPAAIGVNKPSWGIMGEGEVVAVPAPAPTNTRLYLILGGIAAAAFLFLRK